MILLQQTRGLLLETKGRLHLIKSQLIVRYGVFAVKGNGKGGMIADAEGQLLFVQILHRQGVMQGVPLQGEGGDQTEIVGELRQGFCIGAQLFA